MAIKKAFTNLVCFLEENKDKKVSTILDDVITMASTKQGGSKGSRASRTVIKATDGTVVAILDYYFKRWMPLVGEEAVEFGKKTNSPTGYNTTCKAGLAFWNKQQKEAKLALAQILTDVESGELDLADIGARKEEIETARNAIQPTDLGFESLDELYDYLADEGVEFIPLDAE